MPTFLTFTCGFSVWEFSVYWSVHWNSQKSVHYCLVITLWKCEYCLIWALNKSILFDCNSLRVSVLCDMNSEKRFYYSLVWKELSDNVSIPWYKLWESVWYCLPVTLWKCQCCLIVIWNLEKFVVLFASNSLKIAVLFDVSSRKVRSIVCQ